jgi:hypothetical protein
LKDLTDYIRSTNPNDVMVEFFIEEVDRFNKASVIVLNTYDELIFYVTFFICCWTFTIIIKSNST